MDAAGLRRPVALGDVMISMCCPQDAPGAVLVDVSRWGMAEAHYHQMLGEGRVVALRERNGYDDSDFFAVLWDDERGEPVEVEYASTRGWSYCCSAAVDATPEVAAAYETWLARRRAVARAQREHEDLTRIDLGVRVRVARGRKVPVGTEGTVVWRGADQFRPYWRGKAYRIGLRDEAGHLHYTAETNLQVWCWMHDAWEESAR